MASDPLDMPQAQAAVPELPSAPLSGTRGQAMQRLQVGLFGLGSMVLLIGLASVIKTNAEQNEAQVVPEAASAAATTPANQPASDPLAEAGIVPEQAPLPRVTPPPPPEAGDASTSQP